LFAIVGLAAQEPEAILKASAVNIPESHNFKNLDLIRVSSS
jgi:hypothetical protein